ncbi:DUF732 domain-containing protein [Rhodococcus sp. (in: high G+C Gram-positive bacteria)]|uniref:DUF732 domain-containing protein n=1 Tax=Rhodococcus sp. TaxID=1831 RepID=UPI003B8A66FD
MKRRWRLVFAAPLFLAVSCSDSEANRDDEFLKSISHLNITTLADFQLVESAQEICFSIEHEKWRGDQNYGTVYSMLPELREKNVAAFTDEAIDTYCPDLADQFNSRWR